MLCKRQRLSLDAQLNTPIQMIYSSLLYWVYVGQTCAGSWGVKYGSCPQRILSLIEKTAM